MQWRSRRRWVYPSCHTSTTSSKTLIKAAKAASKAARVADANTVQRPAPAAAPIYPKSGERTASAIKFDGAKRHGLGCYQFGEEAEETRKRP